MRIGYAIDYRGDPAATADHVAELEAAGLDIVWAAEAYGFDSVSILGYLAGRTESVGIGTSILNVYSRTPGTLASWWRTSPIRTIVNASCQKRSRNGWSPAATRPSPNEFTAPACRQTSPTTPRSLKSSNLKSWSRLATNTSRCWANGLNVTAGRCWKSSATA